MAVPHPKPLSGSLDVLSGSALGPQIDTFVNAYVSHWTGMIASKAKALCKFRGTRIQAMAIPGTHFGFIRVTQIGGTEPMPDIKQWAFDADIKVPVGGFPPPVGNNEYRMNKPEGVVWRTRTYTRHSGQVIHHTGYIDEAIRRTFTKAQLDTFGMGLATLIGHAVAHKIASDARRQGHVVYFM